MDHFRRRRPALPLDGFRELEAPDELSLQLCRSDLDPILASFPAPRRRLVEDIKLLGMAVPEAAARNGVTPISAKVIVHRCLKRLEENYGQVA